MIIVLSYGKIRVSEISKKSGFTTLVNKKRDTYGGKLRVFPVATVLKVKRSLRDVSRLLQMMCDAISNHFLVSRLNNL
jgi:hypothetical protein